MTENPSKLESLLQDVEQLRDEIALKLKLGAADAKDEWERLEQRWKEFSRKAELSRTAEGLDEALSHLGGELKAGYERLKKAL